MRFTVKNAYARAAGLALSLVLTIAHAEPLKIDFDEGIDEAQILEAIRRQSPIITIDTNTIIAVQAANAKSSASLTGPISGIDTPSLVQDSAPYKEAIQYPPLIAVLEPADRDPLEAEWNGINTERSVLLTDAAALEAEDQRLYARAVALDQKTDRLNERHARLSTEIDNFNRQCTGRPLPPDEYNACVRWQNDLQRRIREHNAEVTQHNAQVEQWRREAADFRNRVGATKGKTKNVSFVARVSGWEQQKIRPFIDRAAAAVRRRSVSTIRLQAQQGHAVDASEAFSKPGLITLSECRAADDRLWAKLTPPQRAVRVNARLAMREWMRNAAAGGGSGPTTQIPFYDKYPHDDDDPRFDLQVIRGRACVPDDCCSK